jgi:DNA polymerase elongation subunit (family B)
LIDDNKKTFLTFMMIAALGKIESIRAFSPVHFTETVFCRNFLDEKKVLVLSDISQEYNEKIDGGFVKEPEKGVHSLIAGVDFASLYPNIKIMLNVSPESFLGYKDDLISRGIDISDKHVSIIGTVFDNKDSVTKMLLKNYYSKRKEHKKKMFEIEIEIDRLTKILKQKENALQSSNL